MMLAVVLHCINVKIVVTLPTSVPIEPCSDVIVSAAACQSISDGGGAPPFKKIGGDGAAGRVRPKIFV